MNRAADAFSITFAGLAIRKVARGPPGVNRFHRSRHAKVRQKRLPLEPMHLSTYCIANWLSAFNFSETSIEPGEVR